MLHLGGEDLEVTVYVYIFPFSSSLLPPPIATSRMAMGCKFLSTALFFYYLVRWRVGANCVSKLLGCKPKKYVSASML